MGERDGEERGHEADSGVFTALQAGDAPARVSKCQRPKFACQPARGEGKGQFLSPYLLTAPPVSPSLLPLFDSFIWLCVERRTLRIYVLAPH